MFEYAQSFGPLPNKKAEPCGEHFVRGQHSASHRVDQYDLNPAAGDLSLPKDAGVCTECGWTQKEIDAKQDRKASETEMLTDIRRCQGGKPPAEWRCSLCGRELQRDKDIRKLDDENIEWRAIIRCPLTRVPGGVNDHFWRDSKPVQSPRWIYR